MDQDLQILLDDLRKFGDGMTEAVRQIQALRAELAAIQRVLEKKGLISAEEFDQAREEAAAPGDLPPDPLGSAPPSGGRVRDRERKSSSGPDCRHASKSWRAKSGRSPQ